MTNAQIHLLEKALGISFYASQVMYLQDGIPMPEDRRNGKTYAHCVKLALKYNEIVNLDRMGVYDDSLPYYPPSYSKGYYLRMFMEIWEKLYHAGIPVCQVKNDKGWLYKPVPKHIEGWVMDEDVIVSRKTYTWNDRDYSNVITEFLNNHLLPDYKKSIEEGYHKGTYMMFRRRDGAAIRHPGATRGHVNWDKDYVITEIKIYEDIPCSICYVDDAKNQVLQFIGRKMVVPESIMKEWREIDESKDNN